MKKTQDGVPLKHGRVVWFPCRWHGASCAVYVAPLPHNEKRAVLSRVTAVFLEDIRNLYSTREAVIEAAQKEGGK